jgi:hypothetical protein
MGLFTADISKWVEKVEGRIDLVVRKISLDMFTRIILKSPVDTGRFRGNWQVAIGIIPAGTLELTDKTGTATISQVDAALLKVKGGDVIYFVNNLPYANRLEYGHSKQAPAGMVRITVEEYGLVVKSAVDDAKAAMP